MKMFPTPYGRRVFKMLVTLFIGFPAGFTLLGWIFNLLGAHAMFDVAVFIVQLFFWPPSLIFGERIFHSHFVIGCILVACFYSALCYVAAILVDYREKKRNGG